MAHPKTSGCTAPPCACLPVLSSSHGQLRAPSSAPLSPSALSCLSSARMHLLCLGCSSPCCRGASDLSFSPDCVFSLCMPCFHVGEKWTSGVYCGLRLLLMTFPGKSLPAAHSELHPTCLFHPSAVLVHLGFCSFPVFLFFHFFMLFFFFHFLFFCFFNESLWVLGYLHRVWFFALHPTHKSTSVCCRMHSVGQRPGWCVMQCWCALSGCTARAQHSPAALQ